ncbi:MAG: ROK family protein, partial [Hyphomicrobiaceae bacterium]
MTAVSEARAQQSFRLGIDLGGTKIAGVVLDACGQPMAETRVRSPQGDYAASIAAICDCIASLERSAGVTASIGIGMP